MESNQESMVTLTGSDQVVRELAHPATGAIEAEKVTITDNKEAGVYELWVDGQTAAGLLYNEAGTRVTILATAVFPKFRGKGIAGNLLGIPVGGFNLVTLIVAFGGACLLLFLLGLVKRRA